ncbi:hypothetical protein SDC9_77514 [bioreactor metagenome]|uniref:Uncharacterized protein n=1 Tax=bioreactor metagenome TaxID=1076179 RepID=A0A644YSW3_9ZZZZ
MADELGEGLAPLVHVADDGLGRQLVGRHPWMGLREDAQCGLQQLGERLRPGDVLDQPHPLVVLDAVGLHLRDRLAAGLVLLLEQHRERVVEDRLDDRHQVEDVRHRLRVEQVEGGQRERGERLVQGEVVLQFGSDLVRPPGRVGGGQPDQHARLEQPAGEVDRPPDQAAPAPFVLVAAEQQVAHVGERVAAAGDDVEDHRLVHPHPRHQRLGGGRLQPLERLLGPRDEAVRGLLADHLAALLRVVAGLGQRPLVLDHVLGRLTDDVPRGVEAGPAGPAGDLVELPGLEQPVAGAVELRQPGEDDGPDRHVDPDAEGVGATDHLEQAGLGELLDQPAVAREHPGVVHADPGTDQLRQGPPEAGMEAEGADLRRDPVLLLTRGELGRQQCLGGLQRRLLGEVDDVRRRLVGGDELLEQLVHRVERPGVRQRDRAFGVVHHGGRPAGALGEVALEEGDVTQGRRHQQELRLRQAEQRHLPGPAAVGLGVVVELVHHHLGDVGPPALAQGDVGEHLGGAGDDRGVGVDRGVAGEHADVLGTEDLAQREEFLRDQRLDRGGVEADPVLGERRELRRGGDQGLAGAGRRGEDHIVAGEEHDR